MIAIKTDRVLITRLKSSLDTRFISSLNTRTPTLESYKCMG